MALTLFGTAANPTDGGSVSEPNTLALTPPGSMVAGDLAVMIAVVRSAAGGGMTVSAAGGQTWNSVTEPTGANNLRFHIWWCEFNGTWSTNPSVAHANVAGATVPCSANLIVFRQSTAGYVWSVDQGQQAAGFAAPASPFTVTITGQTTAAADTVSLGLFYSSDDCTWGSIAGSGWAVAGTAQYRNSTNLSGSFAYKVQTAAGATGNVSKNMNQSDAGLAGIITFASIFVAPPGPVWKVKAGGSFGDAVMKHRAAGTFSDVVTTVM